jgi:MFS family permease
MSEVDPTLPEEEYWDREATKLGRTGLADIRSQAEKWQTTISALLGVIGVVAFVEGPKKLSELEHWPDQWVLIFGVALAAGLALWAIRLAAAAAQGVPKHFEVLDGPELASYNAESAETAASDLKWSRRFAMFGAGVLIFGTLLAWFLGLTKDEDPD